MLEIEMLPAREGDCLWIRYGNPKAPKQILIDGGRAATYEAIKARLGALPKKQQTFELLVITHVDRDHIEGVLSLLSDRTMKLNFRDVWFNGFDHLHQVKLETFGAVQGERLSRAINKNKLPWNKAFKRRSVCIMTKALPTKSLAGGMKLTLLSPDRVKLTKLIPVWEKECQKAGLMAGIGSRPAGTPGLESFGGIDIETLAAGAFQEDSAEANGSSIAVLAQYKGKKLLLTGDAHTDRVGESLRKLRKGTAKIKLEAFKLAHHGSEHNVSRDLLGLVDCKRFLVSSNGSYFKHPTASAIARLVKFSGNGSTLYFNYQSKFTRVWNNAAWKARYGYSTAYPEKKANGTLLVPL